MMVRRTFLSTWLLLLPVAMISAAEPQGSSAAVRDALRYGFAGNLDEQRSLLNSILAVQPNLIIARGHAGFVRQGKEWVDFEDLAKQPAELEKLSEYEQARQAAPDTLEGQLELANWCDQHELEQQARAHLSRVLDFDGDHAAARSRLGFVKQRDDWVSRSERRTEEMRERESTASLQKWRPQIRAIVADLSNTQGGSPADVRDRGKRLAKLTAITDSAAVPALELELEAFLDSVDRQPGSTEHKIADVLVPLVRAIGSIPHPQAGQSLARIATSIALTVPMETPEALVMESTGPRFPSAAELDESVTPLVERLSREVAAVYRTTITQLKNQSRDSFVPILLSGLSSPIQGEYYTFRERDGDVIVRLFYQRETDDRLEAQENRTTFNPKGGNSFLKARSSALSGQRAAVQIQEAHQALQQQNIVVLNRNLRVTDVLRAVTEQPLSTSANEWWNWWNEENEVYLSHDKPLVTKLNRQSVSVMAPPPPPPIYGSGGGSSSEKNNRKKDCLAAGSLIWTARGYAPIEQISAGDLVLSQDPETGELAYKPVLTSTLRPLGPLVEIQVEGEVYRSSGGHPFWVVGEGWVRARKLEAGQKIYGVSGIGTIKRVDDSGQEEPTYNLIVADFHTYFVGQSRIFSHDNTVRSPTGMSVPGLARRSNE